MLSKAERHGLRKAVRAMPVISDRTLAIMGKHPEHVRIIWSVLRKRFVRSITQQIWVPR